MEATIAHNYKILTQQMKRKMSSFDILLPRLYNVLFTEMAKEHNIDLGPEGILNDDGINDKAIQHVKQLDSSATKAIDAMAAQDDSKLKEVLAETQSLRDEIEQLRSSVYEDTLTKVFNRRWMEENYLNSDKKLFDKDGVIAMIDLNDFKYVNDTFGHITGDKVLFFIALQLKRSGADVIRYGGDEFFVIFDENSTKEKAGLKLHNIRESVIKKQLNADGKTFKISFSYGISEFKRSNTIASIVQLADEEMYSDKIQIKKRLALV